MIDARIFTDHTADGLGAIADQFLGEGRAKHAQPLGGLLGGRQLNQKPDAPLVGIVPGKILEILEKLIFVR